MIFALVLSICFTSALAAKYENFAHSSVVNVVNAKKSTWRAGYNSYFAGQEWSDIKLRLGSFLDKPKGVGTFLANMSFAESAPPPPVNLPDNFDVRDRWPKCRNRISQIRDQGRCGSCWAVAAATVATDRTCIQSNGFVSVDLSADDELACCRFVFFVKCGSCNGGYPILAMIYWFTTGLVTGGNYGDKTTCYPYSIAPNVIKPSTPNCGKMVAPPRTIVIRIPIISWLFPKVVIRIRLPAVFSKVCQPGYPISFTNDKHKASSAYFVLGGEAAMKREIYQRGPVEAGFTVFADFPYYREGVYQHISGGKQGGHAVTIIGWGVENSTKYWLAKNSWNSTWGDEGYFKILRGKNHCGIESHVVAGNPKFADNT